MYYMQIAKLVHGCIYTFRKLSSTAGYMNIHRASILGIELASSS